jgi:hypothetical protein
MAPQSKRGEELKKKPPNVTKASSQTPTKVLTCYYVVIKVQR